MSLKKAVVWIFDEGAEDKFPVSLCTLKLNAPDLWASSIKVIIDMGISTPMKSWIDSLADEKVTLIPASLPPANQVIGSQRQRPAQVMLARLMLCNILQALVLERKIAPIDVFLHVDTDTAFFKSPNESLEMEWIGEHIRAVKEWDWVGDPALNNQESMKLNREGTFTSSDSKRCEKFAFHLGIDEGEFNTIETFNSGVWVARCQSTLSDIWREVYDQLRVIDHTEGGDFLRSYSAEENALSVAIYLGRILCRPLPRRFNYFPPRPPHSWPSDTSIGHFITFHKNGQEVRYRKWFEFKQAIIQAGLCPQSLMFPG